ncbi:MAG: DeoR/GlpR transcriptional regulator [Oscillospiraceae bacterium]|nr:DeoR/GlpR transcriptional regulator [Oscillospiraceae bacterium]
MNTIRQEKILREIEKNHVVTIRQLQALCPEVSVMTIHRDLDALEETGSIVKVRGGARSVHHAGDPGYDVRMQENNAGKLVMAQKAMGLIQQGSTVFLDASTTNLMLARSLPDINLNIFTTGPNIAIELCRLHNPNITLCCGTMNRKNMALSGPNTLEMLQKINIDLAFIGVSGCSAEAGFTCGTESDMVVKQMVIRKARTSVLMCGREKFSRLMPYTFARFQDVDYLICDGAVPEAIRKTAEGTKLCIL